MLFKEESYIRDKPLKDHQLIYEKKYTENTYPEFNSIGRCIMCGECEFKTTFKHGYLIDSDKELSVIAKSYIFTNTYRPHSLKLTCNNCGANFYTKTKEDSEKKHEDG